MSVRPRRLETIIDQLGSRPGHEMVRTLVHELCVSGLDVPANEISFEVPVPEVRGRLDALFGATVFEFKKDLRREASEAEEQLGRYLTQRERETQSRYLGVATDGASFVAYELRDGRLIRLDECAARSDDPRGLLRWLDTAITVRADLAPEPALIRAEFGRDSLVFLRSMHRLGELWEKASDIPEAQLKRELWGQHLEFVYGTLIEPEELFLQHTYLTIVAKTMAVRVLVSGPIAPGELLEGTPFASVGLHGAVEADFFDWVLLDPGGTDLVERIARQVERFRLADIKVDVLKALYESLIDPRQRHYLGEYYTPDWLASWMCDELITDPLQTRVLDPSCGSGTFLFHAVRRYLAAAESSGRPAKRALDGCAEHVFGLDVHPVAVLFARVTYLLAIGPERLQRRRAPLSIPVYLGDALQWDVKPLLAEDEVEIAVPGEPPLRFPGSVAGQPTLLDAVLRDMWQLADQGASTAAFRKRLVAQSLVPETDRTILEESYERMRALHESGRNHIWGYIVRNLTRPLWLSLRKGKPHVVIGNPPWLRFNAMSREMQDRFRRASQQRDLWVGGNVATHQDLSAYFFARSMERYLPRGGRIGFVMPLACLSRAQYRGFRTGRFIRQNIGVLAQFEKVWTFNSDVQPLFDVPACVIFAHRDAVARPLPDIATAFRGLIPRKDATSVEAQRSLTRTDEPLPTAVGLTGGSQYRKLFKQGATIVPRRLFTVVPAEVGPLGVDESAPLVRGRTSAQDKRPWKNLEALQGQIEQKFLRPILLGESIGPFRVLDSVMAVIPWDERSGQLLDRKAAINAGYPHLAAWLKNAESLWKAHGTGRMSLTEQLDYYGKLRGQFPIRPLRVVYAKAGIWPAAVLIRDQTALIDHKLYWMEPKTENEGHFLTAILNAEAVRMRIESLQSEGIFGPRDFDKVIFNLPIPRFRSIDPLHRQLSAAGLRAERVAAKVALRHDRSFQLARRSIREALKEDGISGRIDALVTELLDKARVPSLPGQPARPGSAR